MTLPIDGRHFEVLSRLNLHCKNVFDMTIHNFFQKQNHFMSQHDGFELKFYELSRAELKKFRVESSQVGAFQI